MPINSQDFHAFLETIFFLRPFVGEVFGANGPLWSLTYEFWYYVVFYSLLIAMDSLRKRRLTKLSCAYSAFSLAGLSIVNSEWATLGMIWLVGAISSEFVRYFELRFLNLSFKIENIRSLFLLIVIFILPSMIFVRIFNNIFGYLVMTLIITIPILISRNSFKIAVNDFSYRFIIRGSEYSFSLYLIHFPLLGLLSTYIVPTQRWSLNVITAFYIVVLALICLLFSYFFAWLTEFNLSQFRSKIRFLYGDSR